MVCGTPQYMAPEQLAGVPATVQVAAVATYAYRAATANRSSITVEGRRP